MTQERAITVEYVRGPAPEQAEQAFRSVYAEVFADPPYSESEADIAAGFRRLNSRTRNPTFRAALARGESGEPVGFAYGSPLTAHTGWWDQLAEPVPDDMRREDGRRTFGLMEIAVRRAWRRHGIARRLHELVLDGAGVERVLLNVHPDNRPAQAAYHAWGYRKIGEAHPWEGADVHDVMLLDLR